MEDFLKCEEGDILRIIPSEDDWYTKFWAALDEYAKITKIECAPIFMFTIEGRNGESVTFDPILKADRIELTKYKNRWPYKTKNSITGIDYNSIEIGDILQVIESKSGFANIGELVRVIKICRNRKGNIYGLIAEKKDGKLDNLLGEYGARKLKATEWQLDFPV